MPLFNWKEEYSVNVAELDQHHKILIDIVNSIYDNCLRVDTVDCIQPKIKELIDYSEYHFTAEENYMRQIEYFEREEHIELHSMFIFKIKEMQQAYEGNELELTKSMIVFLGKWLLHHVLEEDRKYALYAMGIK
ncbi:MAG TPA: bacteriohemerythrin [Geobacteraceae bacterium]|nr:bacteriohemerythrin [Geobacteraceae bacterium]